VTLDPGNTDVRDQLLDLAAMLINPGRLDPQEATEPVVVATRVGQHLREVVDDLGLAAAGAAGQLGPQDVHAPLQHAPHVGEVGLLLLGLAAAPTQVA